MNVNDYRPESITHFQGQAGVLDQVLVALDAAHQDGRSFDHAIMTGGPGLGKTEIARLISLEMGTDHFEFPAGSIKNVIDLNSILLAATDRAVITFDESHELPKSVQTALLIALDKQVVTLQGTRKGSVPVNVPISDFTLLLCTTEEYLVLQPLRDRMRLNLKFEPYPDDDIVQILLKRSLGLGWDVENTVLDKIARRSRGVPRLGLRLLQSSHRVSRSQGQKVISLSNLERACELEELDHRGLGSVENKYLQMLLDGPARLNVIASQLQAPARTVADVIEPYLIRSGLVVKDDQSKRHLTADGREHVGIRSSCV